MTLGLILIALAIALEPVPLTGYILVFSAEGGTRKGLGFLIGWVLTLVAVVVLTLVVTGGKSLRPSSSPSTISLIVKIVIGTGLLWVAWRQRGRIGRAHKTPRWMKRLDRLNFFAAMGLAFLLQPWGLVAAGVATIDQASLSSAASVVGLALFCVIGSSSYVGMQIYAMVSPEAARSRLDGFRGWINSHREQAIIVLSVGLGLWLIGNSAYLLAS